MKRSENFASFPAFFLNYLLDIIFPSTCIVCKNDKHLLCEECEQKLEFNQSNFCLHCYQKNELGQFCQATKDKWLLEGIIIAGDYKNKVLKKLIKTYKYKSIKKLALNLFSFLDQYIKTNPALASLFQSLANSNTLVIPVPLHKKRQAIRGFNQAELICKLLSQKYKLQLDSNKLRRKRNNPPQAKLKGKARLKNLQNNFCWQGNSLENKTIILFDDICTTGTTLNECALALKNSGAKKIWGLALAKG